MTGERRWAIAGYAYALAVTAVLSYFLLDIPIQLTDSFGNMLKLQGVSLRELVQAEFWQRAYLRPFLWAELKVVFDLANGDYFTWFRGVHVAQVGPCRGGVDLAIHHHPVRAGLLAGQHQRPTLGVGRGRLRQRGGRQQQQHHQERLHAAASSCPDRRGGAGAR